VHECVDGVLIGLEDRDLCDLVALHAVDVGAPNLDRGPVAVEALAHEQCDALSAGQHVDQLELDLAVTVVVADRLDVSDGGVLSSPVAGEWRAAGDVDEDVLGEVRGCVVQSPSFAAAR
jgi:hypothetical protein